MGDSNVEAVSVENDQVNEPTTTSATQRTTSHISRKEVQIKEKSALSKAGSARSRSEIPGRIVSATPSKRSQSANQKQSDPTEDAEVGSKNEWNINLDESDSDRSESSSSDEVSVISDQPRRRQRK